MRDVMKKTIGLLGAACLAASCGGSTDPVAFALDGWEIETLAPVFAAATATGSFTARGDGMRAYGACLGVDLHAAKACDTAADCATGAVVTPATGHTEYCLAPAGPTQKTCWTRNGADMAWCNKVPPPGRIAGTHTTPAVDAAQIQGSGSKTRWLTFACLNAGTYPAFTDGGLPPCASSDPAAQGYRVYAPSATSTFTAP